MDLPMQGDATLLKEKIIKTDTLLQKYQANFSKLKKATELCKFLKKKYEEAKQALEISHLENERTKFKLENLQPKYEEIGEENKRLSNELTKLTEQYQKYTLDTQSTMRNLQDELKMLQELNQYTPDQDNKIKNLEGKLKKLQATEKKYKVEIDKLNIKQNEIYEKHKEEKCTLLKEIEKLQSQINNHQEMSQVKPNLLNNTMDLRDRLNESIQAITDLNHITQDKDELNSGESDTSLLKALNDLKLASSENETLRHQLNMKNREIAALRIKKVGHSVSVQTTKTVNSLKDTHFSEICNNITDKSDLKDIVHEGLHSNEPKINKTNIALPDLTTIVKEHSQEIVGKTSNAVTISKSAVSTQTECFDALNDLKLANTENTKLKQQLNIKNREIAALWLKKSVVSVYTQTEQIIDNSGALCHIECSSDYFPDSCSESDFDDIDDAKQVEINLQQDQNDIHSFKSIKSTNEILDQIQPKTVSQKELSTTMLPSTISAICDMSTQTENLYTGLFTRKPEMAVISTQTAVKTTAFATQTEHKYVSLSTQTDRDDSVSKCIDNSVQNDPTASDEESISDILSEMKNIPRLLSPITDMFDVKIPVAKKTIVKRSTNFANRNWKRVIHTSSLSTQKYLPWKRRMISKHIQSNTVQDSVAKALQILKRANINFTISNETILPQGILAHPRYYCSQQVLSQNQPVESKNNFVEKLSCSFSNCATNYSHMMLNNRDGCTELLGFFKEEKESTTQTKVDIVSHITKKESSPDLVDETAKIVISKLKKEFNLIPKKRRMRSLSSSDSDISDFEKSGLNAERAVKKIKRFQSINHRQYRQTEESTSGFESCSTPLTQYSTQDSQRFGENPLEKSLNGFSPNLQSIETPLSPLSDISMNQISVSKLSMNPSLVDCESQVINQYDIHPNSHRNEEIIGCHMKTPLNDGVPEVSKPKCDFKLPLSPTKYEEGKISSSETRTCTEKPPRKKKKPMGKLKSKTLRQFKEKMLIYQTKHSRAASDCKRTIENKRINENPTQKKFISEATTNTLAEIKSHNGKKHDLMENKLNASKIAKSKQCKKDAKVNDEGGVAKKMSINVDGLKLDSNACGMQEKQPDINMDKNYDKNIDNSSDNIDVSNKVHLKNNKSRKLSANKRQLCQPEFNTATRNSKNSLNCDAPLKNGTDIDSLQNLYSPVSINQYVEPQSKLLKTIEKVEHQETINSVDHKNEKSFDKCYTSDQLVKGVIQPDTDSSLKDLDGAVDNKTESRRRSQRLMKLEVSSSAIVQTSSKEFLNVTNNSTEVSGTNSTEKNELEANVDINCDLDIKAEKNELDIKSVVQTDLPQVSLCDVMDSPASPEHFPEPEDYSIKIIPLYSIESINNTQNIMMDENYIEDKIQQVDNETSVKKNHTQTKFQVGKRLRKGVIKRSTKKKINVLQNVVIHPAKTASVGDNEGDKFGPCDIMSKIMDDMDKNKLSITKKNPDIRNARTANLKLDDKEWRRMILDVAQLIHCDDEMLNFDLQPVEVPTLPQTYLKKRSLLGKADMLIKKLKVSNESENIRDELILEFKRFPPETVVNFILYGLTNDNENTLTKTYHPLLLVTKLQWLFLKLMTQLEQANMRNIFELYLQTAERLFYRYCSRARVVPLTRLYVAICKLHGNVNRVRKLCCEAFYYMENLAVILLHTVLLSWIEIFPMHDNMKCFPIAEVMVQLIHFKKIKNRQHKLYPLKALLNQYYGYPEGPLNCDEFFGALVRKYLCNPVRMLNFAIRLYCKYKDTVWLKKTINQIFKPLVYKIPEDNKEFKATVIVLLANISEYLKISSSDKYRVELEAWFSSLSEGDTPQMIQHSVEYALNKLSITTRWQKRRKKPKSKKKKSLKLSQRNGNS